MITIPHVHLPRYATQGPTFLIDMSLSATATKPTVLVFSQSGLEGGLKKPCEKATVLQAHYNKPGEPAALLNAHLTARAIWIADPNIVLPAHNALSRQVVNYVRRGGATIVLGGYFSSLIAPPDFDKWMRDAWGLPWCSSGSTSAPRSCSSPRSRLAQAGVGSAGATG